jgi:GNAT superfamily N-acetyltransferase
MEYAEVSRDDVPMQLLLEADPSLQSIQSYLDGAWCFVARLDGEVAGACIARPIAGDCTEIFNIAVQPGMQQRGIGSGLLKFVLAELAAKQVRRVELGTGAFGHQLAYYQRLGFRVHAVWRDHFLEHYPEPVIENGIQHKDMLRLSIELPVERQPPA